MECRAQQAPYNICNFSSLNIHLFILITFRPLDNLFVLLFVCETIFHIQTLTLKMTVINVVTILNEHLDQLILENKII